jgi:hypothetical protein
MPWVGLEPTIPAFERTKKVHALDRAASVIGYLWTMHCCFNFNKYIVHTPWCHQYTEWRKKKRTCGLYFLTINVNKWVITSGRFAASDPWSCRMLPIQTDGWRLQSEALSLVRSSYGTAWRTDVMQILQRNHSLTHGAEPFLRSRQLCSHSRTFSILRNPNIHYRVHISPPLVPILSQINPIHITPSYLSKIHFNIVTDSLIDRCSVYS